MRFKIGDEWFDAIDRPLMAEFTKKDLENIANMRKGCRKYCQYPMTYTEDEIMAFMQDATPETALPVCHEICADPDLIMCVDNGGGKDDDATSAAQERERARIHECPFRGNVKCPYDETSGLYAGIL